MRDVVRHGVGAAREWFRMLDDRLTSPAHCFSDPAAPAADRRVQVVLRRIRGTTTTARFMSS